MKCMKRQKVVNRSTGDIRYRCMNKKCDLKGQEVNDDICKNCHYIITKHKRQCGKLKPEPEPEPDYPSMSMQLHNYKEAILRWTRAGKPTRDDEEVKRIVDTICSKNCNWYDPKKKRCKGCGCKVTTGAMAIFNKVKMATEHCPRGFW